MKSDQLRRRFLGFFEDRGHSIIPSSSLVPEGDSSTLFIGSGMQPLVPYLLGEKHPKGTRLCNSQKSFRAEDIGEVGDERHTTFFEMLGNWSLGDYFKKEQLPWIYTFLIDEIKLDPKRLYATVFRGDENIGVPRDEESVGILKKVFGGRDIEAIDVDFSEEKGMQNGRIFYYPAQKNWWSKSGTPDKMPIGEIGGPDSEIFYDLGADLKKHENSQWASKQCHVNCDCGRFIEIGNSVFIEYKKTEKGFELLEQRNVDFGGGLERMVMVSERLDNVFETDLFKPILEKIGIEIEDIRGKIIVADHIRAAVFMISDGVQPSNVERGYILRRLLRRAIYYYNSFGLKNRSISELVNVVVDIYKNTGYNLHKKLKEIKEVVEKEIFSFSKTLELGKKQYEKGESAFVLFTTYGFPPELIMEFDEENKIKRDWQEFAIQMKEHQELSRTASAGMFKGGLADDKPETIKLHTTHHLLLAALQEMFGRQVKQKGSNINSERLRIDFSFDRKLTDEEKKKVEDIVNQKIKEGLDVVMEEMPKEEAQKIGAEMEFGVKYGNVVSVYFIKDKNGNIFSKEFCGGPHVKNTSELGKFKIIKEEAVSSGARRIKAKLE